MEVVSLATYERWDGEIPGDHQFSTLENFAYDTGDRSHNLFQRVANKLVDDWEGNQFAGLMLHGAPGTGKSHAAIGLARALHDQGADIFYRYVPELSVHGASVSNWTHPRAFDKTYTTSGARSTTKSTRENKDDIEIVTSETTYGQAQEVKRVPRNANSVFPSYYEEGIERNPKTVLVLDDYKPLWRPHVRTAIEAASNFGGLIIMTSNFGNVFRLDAPSEQDVQQIRIDYNDSPEVKQLKVAALEQEAEKLRLAFASRLAAGFMEIEFTGQDHRKENAFWTDLLDPSDFS